MKGPYAKPKTTMEPKEKESKEPKSPRFSTSAKSKPKPSQSKPTSRISKCLKVITEESIKDKNPSLVDENFESSNNSEEQAEFVEGKNSHSFDSKDSKNEENTPKETIFVSVKNIGPAFPLGAKTTKEKIVVQLCNKNFWE